MLASRLRKAIVDNDADEIERLLIICDLLHKGLPVYNSGDETYTEKDIPSDQLYEEANDLRPLERPIPSRALEEARAKLKQLRSLDIAMTIPDKESITDKIQKRRQDSVLMFMDGIQAPIVVPSIEDVILMPKFDGCSVGVELVRQQANNFIVSFAHTRGSDSLTGKRRCQDKTELIQQVFNLDKFNELIQHKDQPNTFTLAYKDETQLGNNNPCLTTTINLDEIDKVVLRGEFVNGDRNKLPTGIMTNIGLAAGTINSDVPQYVDYLTFQPFEVSSMSIRHVNNDDTTTTVNYIPSQLSAITFMKLYGLITYPLINLKHIDEKTNMEKIYNYFLSKCQQPLDGVVYCQSMWTYPKSVDESAKRVNYGKYKWKPHNAKHSVVIGVDYTIGKTGRIVPTVLFNPVAINDKNYNKSKTTFTKLKEFGMVDQPRQNTTGEHPNVFGVGLICEIELRQNINPYIANVYPDESTISEPIYIPSICPFCGKSLKWSTSSKDLVCSNDECQGVNIERVCDFLKQIGYKGVKSKTCYALGLYNGEDDHKFNLLYTTKLHKEIIESGVAVRRSIRYKATSANTKSKTGDNNDFDNIISNITLGDFLIAISMFTKKKCDDWITSNKVSRSMKLIEYLKGDITPLETASGYNFFINDVINTIKLHW